MRDEDYARLLEDTQRELLTGRGPAGVLGLTPVALRLLASLATTGLNRAVTAIYTPHGDHSPGSPLTVPVRPLAALGEAGHRVLVVAADAEKEDLLLAALPHIAGTAGDRIRHLRRVPAPPLPTGHIRPPRLRLHRPGDVRRYLDGRDIEIVAGDIAETCRRLEGEDLVLTFIDTDNYTPACAALEVVRDRSVPGGAIVFDHFTGTDRFRYTLGERIAAQALLDDPRWFNLHGTGVFYRQQAGR